MKKKFNKKKIIDQIENVRRKNNTNWMDILRLAFKYTPKETSKIFSKIHKTDKNINKLANLLTKNN